MDLLDTMVMANSNFTVRAEEITRGEGLDNHLLARGEGEDLSQEDVELMDLQEEEGELARGGTTKGKLCQIIILLREIEPVYCKYVILYIPYFP